MIYRLLTYTDKEALEKKVNHIYMDGGSILWGNSETEEVLMKNDRGRMVKIKRIVYIQAVLVQNKKVYELEQLILK